MKIQWAYSSPTQCVSRPRSNKTFGFGQENEAGVELWSCRGQRARAQGSVLIYHICTLHLTWGMVVVVAACEASGGREKRSGYSILSNWSAIYATV